MSLEAALIESAGGDFGLILIAFLVVSLVGLFYWGLKTILAQNQKFNDSIIQRMDSIVSAIHDYHCTITSKIDQTDDKMDALTATTTETLNVLKYTNRDRT